MDTATSLAKGRVTVAMERCKAWNTVDMLSRRRSWLANEPRRATRMTMVATHLMLMRTFQ